jgi:uncharacterized protein YbaP (TraB family)
MSFSRLARSASLGLLLAVFAATAVLAEPPMWVVKDRDSELVLFGSVHVLPPGLAWEPAALRRALARADDVWFELPVDPATEAATAQEAVELGGLPPDQSLFKLLPPEDARRLAKVAQAYDASPVLLDRLQPWLAEIVLADAAYRRAGATTGSGVEETLAAQVSPRTRRRAFETPEQQLAIFSGTPRSEQIASLRQTLKELEDDPDEYQDLIKAWMSGDVAGLDREALRPMRAASPDLFRRIVTERNAAWLKVLRKRLDGQGRTVVVVGVGHLVGPGGLPALLRALGYSVQGP